jgi:hypothetical protein
MRFSANQYQAIGITMQSGSTKAIAMGNVTKKTMPAPVTAVVKKRKYRSSGAVDVATDSPGGSGTIDTEQHLKKVRRPRGHPLARIEGRVVVHTPTRTRE